jgi:hypothetical protein
VTALHHRNIPYKDPQRDANLRSSESGPRGIMHRIDQILDEDSQFFIEINNLSCWSCENGITNNRIGWIAMALFYRVPG